MGKRDRNRVRPVHGNPFKMLEAMWAEHGVVKTLDKGGRIRSATPRQAAQMLSAIQAMLNNPNMETAHRARAISFVERGLVVVREALAQQENPPDKATALVTNILAGKTAEGKEIPARTPDQIREYLRLKFRFLKPDEIEAILRDPVTKAADKQKVMETINQDRAAEFFKQMQERLTAAPASAPNPVADQ